MSTDKTATKLPILTAVVLSLLPWPAVWLGIYVLHNLVLTFALYHGACLLPAAIWNRKLWMPGLRLPNRREWTQIGISTAVLLPVDLALYHGIGQRIVNPTAVINVFTQLGFRTRWLWALGVYFVLVNSVIEELFWRGTVLNLLTVRRPDPLPDGKDASATPEGFSGAWTALTFGTWHYLIVRLLVRSAWAWITVACIVLAGVYFGRIYRRSGSIIVAILWHGLVFDLPLIAILVTLMRG